jgi:23S rRNA maturation mini-RNase III
MLTSSLPNPLPATLDLQHLALVGDAVYELLVRDALMAQQVVTPLPWARLVALKNQLAQAETQAQMTIILQSRYPMTTEVGDLLRRGRNLAPSGRKRSKQGDYRLATALEVLVGDAWCNCQYAVLAEVRLLVDNALTLRLNKAPEHS